MALIVVGVDAELNRVIRLGNVQNPLYQLFREVYLAPLHLDDCEQMVRNIGRQMGLAYGAAAAPLVAAVSGGHPLLARRLCSTVLRLRGADGAQQGGAITLAEVEEAMGEFVRDRRTAAMLDENGLWFEVTNPGLWRPAQIREHEDLLLTLAQEAVPREGLLQAAEHDRAVREAALDGLEQRWVVRSTDEVVDRVKIQFKLFQDWIRRYKLRLFD